MPKEYIYSGDPQERGSMAVSWGKEHCDVQLSIAGPIGWRLAQDGRVRADQEPDNGLDWHLHPTRNEINRLIATLRKARDQAFGKDE